MFVGLQQTLTIDFNQFSTYSHIYGKSKETKDQIKLILQKLNLLHFSEIKCMNIKNITGTFQFLCCKNNENNLQTCVSDTIFFKKFDSRCLLPFMVKWTKLFVSLCSVDNNHQLVEVYLLDKNTQDFSNHQMVTELQQNRNLSVMLVSSNTLVGYRCNYHQSTEGLNMNGSLEYIILRYYMISNDIANILSSYFINSHCIKQLSITNSKTECNQQP